VLFYKKGSYLILLPKISFWNWHKIGRKIDIRIYVICTLSFLKKQIIKIQSGQPKSRRLAGNSFKKPEFPAENWKDGNRDFNLLENFMLPGNFFCSALCTIYNTASISCIISKHRLLSFNFIFRNTKKLQGDKFVY